MTCTSMLRFVSLLTISLCFINRDAARNSQGEPFFKSSIPFRRIADPIAEREASYTREGPYIRTAREHTPMRNAPREGFRLQPDTHGNKRGNSGASHDHTSPDEIFAGSNRSLTRATRMLRAEWKFRARTMVSGSFLPFSRNTGRTRQASMVSAQETNTMKKSEIEHATPPS